ncbi:MAG: YbjN domain-containing protein [Microthrixaceae bacterium]|nr:YbjN domain-containing protein [Microthrixaceae bacterium]
MPPDPGERVATAAELAELENLIEAWLDRQRAENPLLLEADRGEPDLRRWRLRLAGEEKDVTTVWLTVDQRTISYETYVMPAPDEDHARFYEHLMRRNRQFNGVAFCIGDEDGVYLRGQLPVWAVTDDELDRIVGSLYAYVEQCFRPALRIGFASRFPTA